MTQYSDNGWPGIDRDDTVIIQVPGSTLRLRVAPATAWVFTEFAARFHREVECLDGQQLDDWGYAWRNVRGSSRSLSCHASGTAVDFNALRHPRGVKGTFSATELKALRRLLEDFEGVLKWGGDFRSPSIVDEMHFQIRGTRADLLRVQANLKRAEEEEDVSFRDRHVLTDADVEAYGNPSLVAGKSEKSYDELVRFPPSVQRLRRELKERDKEFADRLDALTKAVEALTKK